MLDFLKNYVKIVINDQIFCKLCLRDFVVSKFSSYQYFISLESRPGAST